MPNRRRIGYMPTRRHDIPRNLERTEKQQERVRKSNGGDGGSEADGVAANLQHLSTRQLYLRARQMNIRGRSKMSRHELLDALARKSSAQKR